MEHQDLNIKIKDCTVHLQRLDMEIPDDSDSMEDLPSLFSSSLTRKKIKHKKSSAELLKEHQNLAQNLKGDNEFIITIEETTRRLETVEIENVEDQVLATPDPAPSEENDFKILCIKNTLQFFNSRDVTPASCGYDNICHDSFPVQIYEQTLLSFKQVEFNHIISSFLYSAKECCISDCKSFITFLFKNVSVRNDVSCINACYRVLISLLNSHPDSSCLTFSSAEVFMLLFNYGIDIDNCKFLWTDIKNSLEVPQYQKNSSGIPDKWIFNFKYILKIFLKIIPSCTFKDIDLEKIVIFFMWMSADSSLIKENLYSIVCDCIYVCLEKIKDERWNKSECNIINTLMAFESSTIHEKWASIYYMAESIPNKGTRATKLRKEISFFSLKCLCMGSSSEDFNEDSLKFSIDELQSLIKLLDKISNDLLNYAAKFVDICVKDLGASTEEYNALCDVLKQCEASLSDTAQNEKTNFLKIYAKLRTFCGQKISLHERTSLVKVKSESDNQEFNENYDTSNQYDSEIIDKESISFTPAVSEDSLSCGTNQSDHADSLSSNESCNNVYIKSEYVDEPDQGGTKKIGILIRKKRSSRSSSGNSLGDPSLVANDIKCEDDDVSRQSSEFECHLLNNELGERNTVIQNCAMDSAIPGPGFLVSDISVEYPEEVCDSVKVEPEQFYDLGVVPSEVEKMDIVDSEDHHKLPSTSENYTNESLFEDDLTPLPEICEVKSIARSNMDYIENSPVLLDTDINRKINHESSSTEVLLNTSNIALPNHEIPMLYNASESEIIHYEGSVLNDLLTVQKDNNSITLKQNVPSTSADKNNDLEADEDIIFVEETISPKKLSKIVEKEENIPSPIQRYSEALPELSITPVKNVPSTSIPCKNNLTSNEDIVIVEEKTPEKENADVIFLMSSPYQTKSKLSPKIKLLAHSASKNITDRITTEFNIPPQIEVSKSGFGPQGNSSDSDDIDIVEEIFKDSEEVRISENKSPKIMNNVVEEVRISENKSPKIMNNVVSSPSKSSNNKCHFEAESQNHQCQEVLTSVIKQVDVQKNTSNIHHNTALDLLGQEVFNATLKPVDIKTNSSDFQCNEILNSVLECVDLSMKLVVNDSVKVSNSHCNDSKNEHLILEDKTSHSTKESTFNLRNETDSNSGSIQLNTAENNLDIGKRVVDESSETATFPHAVINKLKIFNNESLNDMSLPNTSGCLKSADISNNVDDENHKCDTETHSNSSMNEISATLKSTTVQSSEKFPNDFQDHNNDTISDIIHESLKYVENYLILDNLDVTNASKYSVKSPVTMSRFVLESDGVKENCISPPQNIMPNSFLGSVTEKSNSTLSDNNEAENQILNKTTPLISVITANDIIVPNAEHKTNSSQDIISDSFACSVSEKSDSSVLHETETVNKLTVIKAKDHTMPRVTSSANSVLKKDKSSKVRKCTQNFRSPLRTNILSDSNQNKIPSSCNTKIMLDSLINSNSAKKTLRNRKRTCVSQDKVAKKSFESNPDIELIKITPRKALLKRTPSYINPSSRIQRKRSWSSLCENRDITKKLRQSPSKYSPVKSPLSAKYCCPKSPKKFFDYNHTRQKFACLRPSLLSKTGVNLSTVLREGLISSSSNNDSEDSDIMELYTDPKRYADKDCIVVYESEDIVVLDSD